MTLRSKTYSLDDRVHEALDALKVRWGSYNKALMMLLVPEGNGQVAKVVVEDKRRAAAAGAMEQAGDNRPKNAQCRHCPKRFAGPRGASICLECKSTGHTLTPAECPACNEGSAL